MSKLWHWAAAIVATATLATAVQADNSRTSGHSLSDIAGTAALAMHAKAEA